MDHILIGIPSISIGIGLTAVSTVCWSFSYLQLFFSQRTPANKIDPIYFDLTQFHPRNAMSQPPFYNIDYSGSYRLFQSKKLQLIKIKSHHYCVTLLKSTMVIFNFFVNACFLIIGCTVVIHFLPGTFYFLTEPEFFPVISLAAYLYV